MVDKRTGINNAYSTQLVNNFTTFAARKMLGSGEKTNWDGLTNINTFSLALDDSLGTEPVREKTSDPILACAINELESGGNKLVVLDLKTNSEYINNANSEIFKIAFMGGRKIITGHSGEIYIWSINKRNYDDFFTGEFTIIDSMDYENNKIVVTTSGQDFMWVYGVHDKKLIKQVKSNTILSKVIVKFINENELLYTARSENKQL